MKQCLCVLLSVLIIVSLTACGSANDPANALPEEASNSASSAIQETQQPEPTPDSADEEQSTAPETVAPTPGTATPEDTPDAENKTPEKADVDLTVLSSTMVYAEVNNIMMMPEDYIGRLITMEGLFYTAQGYDENGETDPNVMYFVCIIEDATACCAQGIEFVLADETAVYPEDYPPEASEIIVTGEFQAYTENNYTYYHLINAKTSVKQS